MTAEIDKNKVHQSNFKKRRKEQGFKRLELWVTDTERKKMREYLSKIRHAEQLTAASVG